MADATLSPARAAGHPLPSASPESLGLDPERLELLYQAVQAGIDAGQYPGAAVALARHGKLAASKTFGEARLGAPATDDTLWLMFSKTKPITTSVIWQLVERGVLAFDDKVSAYIPEFARHGKGDITLYQVLTHQGGYPNSKVTAAAWADHDVLRQQVADFTLEWTPGSRMHYHGESAHWTAAVVIEAVTGKDYRTVIREQLLDPIGITDLLVGVPERQQGRCVDMHTLEDGRQTPSDDWNSAACRAAGRPGGGGYTTAPALTAFYQMLLAGGTLNGKRVLSPRTIAYTTKNHTGDRVDTSQGVPMHRGIGVYLRGDTSIGWMTGTLAPASTFGHGGAGSSISWADPTSGLSFTYIQNSRRDGEWIRRHLDCISNIVHSALVEP
ncbi:MAG: beta-lactamase family protein [Chloroflexi bacterium]|nr:beta-lactamase family protein [Chloroflexota bacterium]